MKIIMELSIINPSKELSSSVKYGASIFVILKSRLIQWVGGLFNKNSIPGFIQPINYRDPVSGYHIEIKITPLFTKLSVNGRDFYFKRFSGRFDGTGVGCD